MKQIPNDLSELAQVPVGETVQWGTEPVIIHARSYGRTLVEYLQNPRHGHHFFEWGMGGGSSLPAPLTAAVKKFEETVAFHKNFWDKRLAAPEIVMKGEHYSDGGYSKDRRGFLGFGGSLWILRDLHTGEVWKTNNLWHQGVIPPEYRVVDTHETVSGLSQEEIGALPTKPLVKGLPPCSADQQRVVEL